VLSALRTNQVNEIRAAQAPNLIVDNSIPSMPVAPRYQQVNQVYAQPARPVKYIQPGYAPPSPIVQLGGYDDKQLVLVGDQYKKTAERYYSEFNENSKVMTDSLKKIENIVVEVLNDQVEFHNSRLQLSCHHNKYFVDN
jgi:hypothetical protein